MKKITQLLRNYYEVTKDYNMKKITQKKYDKKYKKHLLWLDDNTKGQQLEFVNKDLSDIIFDQNSQKCIFFNCKFKYKCLDFIDFTGSSFSDSRFIDVGMYKTNFSDCDLRNCVFNFCYLSSANFNNADLKSTKFNDLDGNYRTNIGPIMTRTDGYQHIAQKNDDGIKIYAGCVVKNILEARKYWTNHRRGDGSKLSQQSLLWLDMVEAHFKEK